MSSLIVTENHQLTSRAATALALVERARDYAAAGMAGNTQRAYRADWADFTAWCDETGLQALPAAASTLSLYLTDRAGLVAVATLARRMAAIRAAHRQAGEAVPASFALEQVWSGIRRAHGRPARPKRAMLLADVRLAVQAAPDTLAGLRDRAIILVGFAGALRRSELVAIELEGEDAGPVRVRFVAGGAEIRCASCASLLGRELVARDAADAVHCRVCEARRLDALQTNAERYEAVLSPLAAEVKP